MATQQEESVKSIIDLALIKTQMHKDRKGMIESIFRII